MKKAFLPPEITVLLMSAEDIVRTSGPEAYTGENDAEWDG